MTAVAGPVRPPSAPAAAWLVAQHADFDVEFQQWALAQLTATARAGQADRTGQRQPGDQNPLEWTDGPAAAQVGEADLLRRRP